MLNRKNVKWGQSLAIILTLLFLALAATTLWLFHSYTQVDTEIITLTPTLKDANGWEIFSMDENGRRIPLTPEQTSLFAGKIYLSRRLDPSYEEAGYTTLETSGPVSVFLDGELLYTTSPGSGDSLKDTALPEGYAVPSAGESPRMTLPPGYGGKNLTLVFNRGADVSGTPMALLTNRALDTALVANTANSIGMPAAAYMTAAFLLLGLLFYSRFRGRWDWPMLLLTLAAFFQSLYQLRAFSLLMIFDTALDIRVAALIPTLFVALPLSYLLCQIGGRRRGLRVFLALLPAAISLLPQIFYLFHLSVPVGVEKACGNALYLSIVITLIYAVQEARTGNRTFRLFLAELGILLGTLAVACLFSPSLSKYIGLMVAHLCEGDYILPIYWCGTALFVLCAVLSIGNAIHATAEAWARAELLAAQVSALESRVSATRAAEEAIRIERHDLRHRLQIVAEMVEKDEKDSALSFLGAAQTRLKELKPSRWCQNLVLDAVFSSYFEQAKQQHIEVEASLAIPDELPVDAAELSTVFANALENAIHACVELPEGERRISCKCLNHPGLMFEVTNTYAGEIHLDSDGIPLSSRLGHGFGTRSIAAFCEKHGAALSFEAKDGLFRMRVIL